MQSEYLDYAAIGLAELARSGQVSARELIDTAITRAEAVDPALNAIVLKDYQAARDRASWGGRDGSGTLGVGPLAGVPYLIKDLECTGRGFAHVHGMPPFPAFHAH